MDLWKYFDIICGNSIGGIQAIAYSLGTYLLPTLLILLTTNAASIFTIQSRSGMPCNLLGQLGLLL
jgi:patatin-like phospholipase/acyl hydrolase